MLREIESNASIHLNVAQQQKGQISVISGLSPPSSDARHTRSRTHPKNPYLIYEIKRLIYALHAENGTIFHTNLQNVYKVPCH